MSTINLNNKIEFINASNAFIRISLLDSVWTEHLASSKRLSASDIEALKNLTDCMQECLVQCEQSFERLQDFIIKSPARLESAYRMFLKSDSISSEQITWLRHKVEKSGGICKWVLDSIEQALSSADSERENLRKKMRWIKSGKFTKGDLSKEWACRAAASGLAGGVLSGAVTGGAGWLVAAFCLGFAIGADC